MPVVALYHTREPGIAGPRLSWRSCDLLDIMAVADVMQGITHVYHCAATVSFDSRRRDEMIHNNITATSHVVDAALEAGVQKLLHVSSVASLGRTTVGDDDMITEETHWEEGKANSAYAISKFHAEMEVWRAMAEGLNAVVVNPGIILGEGDWSKGSANLMQIVYDEFPWYTEGVNAWVDVKDVADAMVLLMNSPLSEERFVLSSGNFSYKEIFTAMAVALGRTPPSRLASPWMTEIVWRAEVLKSRLAGKETTISKESARTAQAHFRYSDAKFRGAFPGFRYRSLEETVQRMAGAFLANTR